MRAFKFRAWNKETNHMNVVNGLSYNAVDDQLSHASLRVDRLTSYIVRISVLELMQFTGLLDKSGKEIYEGDIVKNITYEFNGVVFFENGSFWVREYLSHVDEGLYDDREKETRWSINLEWDIIGNIYEQQKVES